MKAQLKKYQTDFFNAIKNTEFTLNQVKISEHEWFTGLIADIKQHISIERNSIYGMGNGASNSLVSHFCTDCIKQHGLKAHPLTDASTLTCFNNDYERKDSFKSYFEKMDIYADMIFAVSSSGQSENIVNAARYICNENTLITLSAFNPNNELRKLGTYNLFVPTMSYGIAECSHAYFLHKIVDLYNK